MVSAIKSYTGVITIDFSIFKCLTSFNFDFLQQVYSFLHCSIVTIFFFKKKAMFKLLIPIIILGIFIVQLGIVFVAFVVLQKRSNETEEHFRIRKQSWYFKIIYAFLFLLMVFYLPAMYEVANSFSNFDIFL